MRERLRNSARSALNPAESSSISQPKTARLFLAKSPAWLEGLRLIGGCRGCCPSHRIVGFLEAFWGLSVGSFPLPCAFPTFPCCSHISPISNACCLRPSACCLLLPLPCIVHLSSTRTDLHLPCFNPKPFKPLCKAGLVFVSDFCVILVPCPCFLSASQRSQQAILGCCTDLLHLRVSSLNGKAIAVRPQALPHLLSLMLLLSLPSQALETGEVSFVIRHLSQRLNHALIDLCSGFLEQHSSPCITPSRRKDPLVTNR